MARAWPAGGPGRAELRRVHGWLAEASWLGFLPVPCVALDGQTLHERAGRLWELSPWLPGRADRSRPPSRARLRSGFAGLAGLHGAWARHGGMGMSRGLAQRGRELDELVRGGFRILEGALDASPPDALRDLARRWLDSARRLAPAERDRLRGVASGVVRLQPCLRDARADHFLFEGDRLTGVVDFGATDFEAPAADLARLLGDWVGPDLVTRAEALDAYAAVRPLSAAEVALIDAFGRPAALLMGGHWATWHFVERRTFDDPDAVALGLRRGLDRLAELVA